MLFEGEGIEVSAGGCHWLVEMVGYSRGIVACHSSFVVAINLLYVYHLILVPQASGFDRFLPTLQSSTYSLPTLTFTNTLHHQYRYYSRKPTVRVKSSLSGLRPQWHSMQHHPRRPLLRTLAVILILTLLVTLMTFACVSPCDGTFSTRAGLIRHQNVCTTFRISREVKLDQRRLMAVKSKLRKARSAPYPPNPPPTSNAESSGPNLGAEPSTTFDSTMHGPDAFADSQSHLELSMMPEQPRPGPLLPLASSSLPQLPPRPPSPPKVAARIGRVARQPQIFLDELPVPHVPIPAIPYVPPVIRKVILHVRDFFRSATNRFHILREYHHRPSYDPDAYIKPEELSNFRVQARAEASQEDPASSSHPPPPWPFQNMSQYLLMSWFHSGGTQKSEGEVNRLIKEVIATPDFQPADLTNFTVHQGNKTFDNAYPGGTPFSSDDWREVSVDMEIPVPFKNQAPKTFRVQGLHYRSITEVIKTTWESISFLQFHLSPFRRIHIDPSTRKETRIYDEVYTSDAWIEAHDKLQKRPNEPGCKLEKVIAGLMFWSDSTHLTNFGTASVWPLYMYFANLSKYMRARPNSGACHHIAYLPYVSHCSTLIYTAIERLSSYLTALVIS